MDTRFTIEHDVSCQVAIIPSYILQDKRLSMKEIGLYARLRGVPAGTRLTESEILSMSDRDGRDATRAMARGLRQWGLLVVEQQRSGNGRFTRTVWRITDRISDLRHLSAAGKAVDGKAVHGAANRMTGNPSTVIPPCTEAVVVQNLSNTTTGTSILTDLIFPNRLDETDRPKAAEWLAPLTKEIGQQVLDEWDGAMSEGRIARPLGYLRRLASNAAEGTFSPDKCRAVASARERRKREHEDAQARAAAKANLKVSSLEVAKTHIASIRSALRSGS